MKLYINETSPFSRAVVITAALTSVPNKPNVELIWVDPWSSPRVLADINPFSSIPTLECTDGTVMTESLCICQYLIGQRQSGADIKNIDPSDARAQALLGFAKTLMETAFRSAILARDATSTNDWLTKGQQGIRDGLAHLTKTPPAPSNDLAYLYLAVALQYVQFRHPALFESHEQPLCRLIEASPFADIMERISLAALGNKPKMTELLSRC